MATINSTRVANIKLKNRRCKIAFFKISDTDWKVSFEFKRLEGKWSDREIVNKEIILSFEAYAAITHVYELLSHDSEFTEMIKPLLMEMAENKIPIRTNIKKK